MRISIFVVAISCMFAQEIPVVTPPSRDTKAPSDAVVLFDGTTTSGWTTAEGSPAACDLAERIMTCVSGVGNIYSKQKFRSAQIHLEFNVPLMPDEHDQLRGNSGVYLHGRYEIQILDSYRNATYPTGMAGALYGQTPPLVNAARPPGEWQTYDIIFHAPQCSEKGELVREATVTLFSNRVLALDHVGIMASRDACVPGRIEDSGPLMLQDHSGPGLPITRMQFRNIWLRHLDELPAQ
ncbi:MAG TPA: DUF1080 domain-containing protein [Bryobacteraceae bacterium]|nr:DUF1080 domain-containing protein [Bryobacteraceae bacterium]